MIRRIVKWAAGILAVLIVLPVVAVGIFVAVANTDPGRRLIESQTASLTGGMVHIRGLGGRFPDAPRIGEIEVSDAKGGYVTIQGLELDWSPLKLLSLTATNRSAHRQAHRGQPPAGIQWQSQQRRHLHPAGAGRSSPPQVDQIAIGAPVAGTAATFTLDGSGELKTLTDGTLHLNADRLGVAGHYTVDGIVAGGHMQVAVKVNEPANGLIATIAKLPDIGAIGIEASVNGPRDALATTAHVSAGPLQASASGTIDLVHESADMAVKVDAPAMHPAPGVSWELIGVDATVHGPFARPDAKGTVLVRALNAAGARIGTLTADVSGNAGRIALQATAADLHVPGPKPDILAAAPVVLNAAAQLDAPTRPVSFTLGHPLFTIDGSAKTAGEQQGQAHIVLPDLAPLAAVGAVDLQGHAALDLQAALSGGTSTATLAGTVGITGGMAPVPALIGPDARIDIAASMHGQDITLSRLAGERQDVGGVVRGGLDRRQRQAGLDGQTGRPRRGAAGLLRHRRRDGSRIRHH